MECYFCDNDREAKGECQEGCGRFVCKEHSRIAQGRLLCIECFCGGADALLQGAYNEAISRTGSCVVCQKKILDEALLVEISRQYTVSWFDLKKKLEGRNVEVVKFSFPSWVGQEFRCPDGHLYCKAHVLRPIEVKEYTHPRRAGHKYNTEKPQIDEIAVRQCSVCQQKWDEVVRCIQREVLDWV